MDFPVLEELVADGRLIAVGTHPTALSWQLSRSQGDSVAFRKHSPDLNVFNSHGTHSFKCLTAPTQIDSERILVGSSGCDGSRGSLPPTPALLVVNVGANRKEKEIPAHGPRQTIYSLETDLRDAEKPIAFSGSDDRTIRTYDILAESSTCRQSLSLPGTVDGLCVLPWNRNILAARVQQNSIAFVDTTRNTVVQKILSRAFGPHLAVNEFDRLVFSCSERRPGERNKLYLQAFAEGQDGPVFISGDHRTCSFGVTYLPSKRMVVCCDRQTHVSLRDVRMMPALVGEFYLHTSETLMENCAPIVLGNEDLLGIVTSNKVLVWNVQGKTLGSVECEKRSNDLCYFQSSGFGCQAPSRSEREEEGESVVQFPKSRRDPRDRIAPFLGQKESNPLLDYSIICESRTIRVPSPFLAALNLLSADQVKSCVLVNVQPKDIRLAHPDAVVSLLLGYEIDIPPKALFSFYVLFKELGLKKHAFLICKKVAELTLAGTLVHLAHLSEAKYEPKPTVVEDDEEVDWDPFKPATNDFLSSLLSRDSLPDLGETPKLGYFESAFTLACYNALHPLSGSFDARVSLACQKYLMLDRIQKHEASSIVSHPEFRFTKIPISFANVAAETFVSLHRDSCPASDLVLSLEDDVDDEEIKAHAAILRWRSPFFASVLNFPGVEASLVARGMPFVVSREENLCIESLRCLVEFLYTGKLSTERFVPLMELSIHAHKWNEPVLATYLDERLRHLSSVKVREHTFEAELKRCVRLLRTDVHPVLLRLRRYWIESRYIGADRLENLIDRNWQTQIVESQLLEFSHRIQKFEEQVEKIKITLKERSDRRLSEEV